MYRVPSAFFDQLIEHIDPHAPKRSAQRMHAQHICAAWLVLLRVQLNLTLDDVAEAAGIPQPILCRLESGIAGNVSETPNLVARLGETLARPGIEARRIAQVATIAAGGAEPSPNVMAEVLDDVELGTITQTTVSAPVSSSADLLLEVALHADLKKRPGLLYRNTIALQVLTLLASRESDFRGLWYAIDPHHGTAKMAQVGGALEALHAWGLVRNSALIESEARRPTLRYAITATGRQALAATSRYGATIPHVGFAPEPG